MPAPYRVVLLLPTILCRQESPAFTWSWWPRELVQMQNWWGLRSHIGGPRWWSVDRASSSEGLWVLPWDLWQGQMCELTSVCRIGFQTLGFYLESAPSFLLTVHWTWLLISSLLNLHLSLLLPVLFPRSFLQRKPMSHCVTALLDILQCLSTVLRCELLHVASVTSWNLALSSHCCLHILSRCQSKHSAVPGVLWLSAPRLWVWYPALKPPPSHLATLTPSPGHGIEATASGTTLMPLSCRFTSLFSSLDGFVKVGAGSSSLCIRAL